MRYSALELVAAPLGPTSGAHADLAAEPAHRAAREAFEQLLEAPLEQGGSARHDLWVEVIKLCEDWLRCSRDVRPAAMIAVAWTRFDAERGLQAGLRLLRAVVGQCGSPPTGGDDEAAGWIEFFGQAQTALQAAPLPTPSKAEGFVETGAWSDRESIGDCISHLESLAGVLEESSRTVAAREAHVLREALAGRLNALTESAMRGDDLRELGLDIHVDRAVQHALLDRILCDASADQAASSPGSGTLSALKTVADRHRGQPFSLNPVTMDLVAAALHEWFAPPAAQQAVWRVIAGRVARTLYDDPRAHERLAALWGRLAMESAA